MGNCCHANKDDHILDMNNLTDQDYNQSNAKVDKAKNMNRNTFNKYDSIDNDESENKVVKVRFYKLILLIIKDSRVR